MYSECNINANILFNKDKYVKYNNNQRDTTYIASVMLQLNSNQMACSDRLFGDGLITGE